MGTWSDAIAMEMGHDKPAPIIIGRQSISQGNPSVRIRAVRPGCRRHERLRRLSPPAGAAAVRAEPAHRHHSGADARHRPVRERRLHAAGRRQRAGQLGDDHARRQAARRLRALVRTARDDAGDLGVRIRQRHDAAHVRRQRDQVVRRHHVDAGADQERPDQRQLQFGADVQPGRRLDGGGQRRRRLRAAHR